MAGMKAYSALLDQALCLSALAHRDQVRKGSDVPYVIHPVHAAVLLIRHDFPEEAVLAAVLHDVVEDTAVTLAELEARFGATVARLVDQVSEVKRQGEKKLPWRVRKEEQLARLEGAEPLAAAVKTADALHNCHAMLKDLETHGSKLWGRFRGSAEDQLWYYSSLVALLKRRLPGHPLTDELDEAVARLHEVQRQLARESDGGASS